MGRILVLLLFVGLAAIFVVIYNAGMPVYNAPPSNSNTRAEGNKRATKDSQAEKRGKAHSSRRAAEKHRNAGTKASPGARESALATGSTARPTETKTDPVLTVNDDSTPVYTANSKRSKVIRVLQKGEKVRPDVEVLDSNGRWRVVRGPQKEKPGFVLEDQIRPSTESSKNQKEREIPKQF